MSTPKATPSLSTRGEVITFYSYKGGTGRSMLLANVGWQLASVGQRVLLIDWDLEAPGLHRYFRPFLGDDVELREQEGVIQWLTDYWDACLEGPDKDVETLVRDYADPRHYVRKLDTGSYLTGGIDLLCAGRQDKLYAESVADFDFTRLYQRLRGEQFVEEAKRVLVGPGGYDYVLVDSRTGVSDTSGFCTVALADTLVVCFTYNNQSVIGASQIARDIKSKAEAMRDARVREGTARRFRVFAVPSRVDDLDPERLERRQKHAWGLFADLLTDVPPSQQPAYWGTVQIRNQGLFAYEEVLAACMNRPTDTQSVLGAVTQLTRMLTDDAFVDAPALGDDQRRELREQFGALAGRPATLPRQDAWSLFIKRMPEPGAREALLQGCFQLLVQLFSNATSMRVAEPSARFVRTLLLESEFTLDERRLAEVLTSMGVTHRRITEDRQRGLMIADESILANWDALLARLMEHGSFIATREKVRQARRSWDSGGRSIAALRAIQGQFAQFEPNDEQRAWMGRPNLQLLQSVQELRAIDAAEHESKERLARIQEASQASIADFRKRQDELETQRAARERDLLAQAETLRVETQRAERNAVRFRTAGIAVGVFLGLLALIGYVGLQRQVEQRQETLAALMATQTATEVLARERDRATKQLAELNARISESDRIQAAQAALRFYGEGTQLMVQAAKKSRKDYDETIQAAFEAYTKAIQADPTLAEAYRGRALARGNARDGKRDAPAELADWAEYYDLRPSLSGRSQLVLRALKEPHGDEKLLSAQLDRLVEDAKTDTTRDATPRIVANSLESVIDSFPRSLQGQARSVADALRLIQDNAGKTGKPGSSNSTPQAANAAIEWSKNSVQQTSRPVLRGMGLSDVQPSVVDQRAPSLALPLVQPELRAPPPTEASRRNDSNKK